MTDSKTGDRIPVTDMCSIIEAAMAGLDLETDTPQEHVITAGILTAALPQPDNGTVDAREAALSVIEVIESRLGYPYALRRDHLRKRLTEESERYEEATGLTPGSAPPAAAVSVLRCQWCGNPIPVARGPKARYCKNSHRVSAHRAKKREADRSANEVPAGSR